MSFVEVQKTAIINIELADGMLAAVGLQKWLNIED